MADIYPDVEEASVKHGLNKSQTRALGKLREVSEDAFNKNRHDVELTDYLKWIKGQILKTLTTIGDRIKMAYFIYDGAFGNNECLVFRNFKV